MLWFIAIVGVIIGAFWGQGKEQAKMDARGEELQRWEIELHDKESDLQRREADLQHERVLFQLESQGKE